MFEQASRKYLAPRQREILQYAMAGKSNKEIARLMQIKEKTVKNQMTTILRKTDAFNRTQAVVLALQRGWIQWESA